MVLERSFYQRPTLEVAKELLGKFLVRELESSKQLLGKIIEVEAYCGSKDLACHSSRGRTKRTEIMFGPAGLTYVYLIYGIHHCLNIVTEEPGAAVLIRALELSPFEEKLTKIASGPGKLTKWMKIDRDLNGWDLTTGKRLWVEDHGKESFEITAAPRIGVAYAGEYAKKPWRLFIKDNEHVSRI